MESQELCPAIAQQRFNFLAGQALVHRAWKGLQDHFSAVFGNVRGDKDIGQSLSNLEQSLASDFNNAGPSEEWSQFFEGFH